MSILTFKQYVKREQDEAASEYGLSTADVNRFYPSHSFQARWWSYVLEAFESGEDFSPQGMVTLSSGQLRDLSRTTRALRGGMDRSYYYRAGRIANAS